MGKKSVVSLAGCAVVLVAAILVMVLKPFLPDLDSQGHMVIGGLLITVSIWIFKPFDLPFSSGGLFFASFLLFLKVPPPVVFSGFTQPALWTLIPALFFGLALQKTGLGRLIAIGVIRLFKPSYPTMILAWLIIGVALSLLTPSITVRVAIIIPIAVQYLELFNVQRGSKGNSLVLLTAFAVALLPGTGWMTGALWGPIVSGMCNAVPGMQGLLNFDNWFKVAFIPMEIITILTLVGGYFVLRPKDGLSQQAAAALKAQKSEPMTRDQKIVALILCATFALFTTSSLHGIPDAAICMLAVVMFFVCKILDLADFSTGISWDLAVFLGVALGLSSVFAATGVSAWMAGVIVPAIAPLAVSPWVFMFGMVLILFAWRFVDIALMIPTMAIITPILPAINDAYGISPLVWVLIFIIAGNSMLLVYQNMWALMAQSITGDRPWTAGHLRAYGTVYYVASLIGLAVAVPLYISFGLF
ncbi:MAG: anion permease [Actinomycetia bacterium]|nr:anion permease [Actinomycetes bacterium]